MTTASQALPRLLTIPEIAAQLRLSTKTIRRMIGAKTLPAHRLGRALRVSENDLRVFLVQRKQ